MDTNTIATASSEAPTCGNCPSRALCLPDGATGTALAHMEQQVAQRLPLQRHQILCLHDAPCTNLFAIRQGQFKSEQASPDGGIHVLGFHMPGQVIGLEGLGSGHYGCDTVALTDSLVCVIPYAPLAGLLAQHAQLNRQFHRLMANEIARHQARLLLLGNGRAASRLAGFLLDQAACHSQQGTAPASFRLYMSRHDIGSYLGLTVESISRLLATFRRARALQVRNRAVWLLEPAILQAIAAGREQVGTAA